MDLVSQRRELSTHTRTHALCPSLALRGGGGQRAGEISKKKKWGFRIFSFLSRNFMPRKLSSFDCAFSTLYTLYTILKITGTESSDLNFTRSEQEHATLRYA